MSRMKELSQAIDELTACGERLIRTANAIRDMFTDDSEEAEKPAVKTEPTGHKPTAAPTAEEPKKYTFQEVRKAFSAKSHAGYTAQVKALIARYGADRLSDVKEEDYPRLMADLEEIV